MYYSLNTTWWLIYFPISLGDIKRPSHTTSMDSSTSDEKHTFKKKAPFNSTTGQFMPLGYFANDIIFMKLYANLSAAYSSHKVKIFNLFI